jgi:hypothetical protein
VIASACSGGKTSPALAAGLSFFEELEGLALVAGDGWAMAAIELSAKTVKSSSAFFMKTSSRNSRNGQAI